MNDELKPINNNDFNEELKEEDKFASKFPDWDLVPANQVVRRVNRK